MMRCEMRNIHLTIYHLIISHLTIYHLTHKSYWLPLDGLEIISSHSQPRIWDEMMIVDGRLWDRYEMVDDLILQINISSLMINYLSHLPSDLTSRIARDFLVGDKLLDEMVDGRLWDKMVSCEEDQQKNSSHNLPSQLSHNQPSTIYHLNLKIVMMVDRWLDWDAKWEQTQPYEMVSYETDIIDDGRLWDRHNWWW